jgi:hypothetical protein
MQLQQYLLQHRNPKTGFTEKVVYTGGLRQKPSGWSVVKQVAL